MTDNGEAQPDPGSTRHQPQEVARAATLRMIERHGPQVMRTARRYAATAEDAEDAYQRGIEIMLTKAPDIPDAELLPWLKTVVRHEAFALRRKNERIALGTHGGVDGDVGGEDDFVSLAPTPVEQAERLERLRLGAEALNGLKPQEAKALALLAQGYSYRQICEKTGWSYTKVNRCLAEGRQRFVQRVAGIESGAECERLAPKLSALVDGEVDVADVPLLRRHLRGCFACQVTMREHQLAPAVVGALLPLPLLERASWPIERLADLTATLRLKIESLVRSGGIEAASSPTQFALSGGTRGLASTGLAKGLALLCVGGAGVGGAVAAEEVLDPDGPPSARAATDRAYQPESAPIGDAKSPDARLVAERLGGPDSRRSGQSGASRSLASRARHTKSTEPAADGDPQEGEPAAEGRALHRKTSRAIHPPHSTDSRPVHGHRRSKPSARPQSGSPCPETRDRTGQDQRSGASLTPDDEYGDGARPSDEYGDGARPSDEYGDGARPSDEYGEGARPSDEYDEGAGPCFHKDRPAGAVVPPVTSTREH